MKNVWLKLAESVMFTFAEFHLVNRCVVVVVKSYCMPQMDQETSPLDAASGVEIIQRETDGGQTVGKSFVGVCPGFLRGPLIPLVPKLLYPL